MPASANGHHAVKQGFETRSPALVHIMPPLIGATFWGWLTLVLCKSGPLAVVKLQFLAHQESVVVIKLLVP